MEKNFWNDAAKYGAIVAVVSIAFSVLAVYRASALLGFVSLLIFVGLLYYFAKRRADLYADEQEGYRYGRVLKYIFCMMLIAGIIIGVWQIFAVKLFFTDVYEQQLETQLDTMSGMYSNMYSQEGMDMFSDWMHTLTFSPVWIFILSLLGTIIKGCFWGLFIAGFVQRRPNPFMQNNGDE